MLCKRVIPCLDVDGGRVKKGVRFKELRDAGDPVAVAAAYDAQGADEILLPGHHRLVGRASHHAGRRARHRRAGVPAADGGRRRAVRRGRAARCCWRAPTRRASTRPRWPTRSWCGAPPTRSATRRSSWRSTPGATRVADARVGGVHARRPPADRPGRRRLVRADGAKRGRRDPADQHGPRRHARRLRPRAHARRGRPRADPGNRVGRRGQPGAPATRGSPTGTPRRCWRRPSFTSASATVGQAHEYLRSARRSGARRGAQVTAAETLLAARSTFDAAGLVPVIAQEARTGMVRMMAWANREALARTTLATGDAHFWSRSRRALWRKGETLGQRAARARRPDRLRRRRGALHGDAEGPSCHTGATSLFLPARRRADGALVEDDGPGRSAGGHADAGRRRHRAAAARAPRKVLRRVAAGRGLAQDQRQDHRRVGRAVRGAAGRRRRPHRARGGRSVLSRAGRAGSRRASRVDAVFDQLRRRFGVSGIDEKASRKK